MATTAPAPDHTGTPTTPDRPTPSPLWRPVPLALLWALPKIVVVALWITFTNGVQGDPMYYHRSLLGLAEAGPGRTLREYPTPVIWLLEIPRLLSFGSELGYVVSFSFCMLLLDAAFTWALWRRWRREGTTPHPWAVLFWIVFVFLMSPTAFLRFDLLPAVLAGGALLLLAERRPAWAGAAIGLGAATKLWPALLWVALMGRRENRVKASLGFWGTGIGLALASLVWAGWARLVSPLTWQTDRGLQVESVWATAPMLQHAFGERGYASTISKYQAFEIFGPSVAGWLVVAKVATVVGMAGLLLVMGWWLRSPRRDDLVLAGLVMVLASATMILTNKTFSTQYVLWLGGPLAATLALGAERARDGLPPLDLRRLVWSLVAVTFLTAVVYPLAYDHLVHQHGALTVATTLVLTVRNLAFLAFVAGLVGVIATRVRAR